MTKNRTSCAPSPPERNAPSLWQAAFPWPDADDHKHSRGRLSVVTGPPTRTGAARLAARAGLRLGAGQLTLQSPKESLLVNAIASTAVMVDRFDLASDLSDNLQDQHAVVIGPALGLEQHHARLVEAALETVPACVLDADVFTLFRDMPDALFARITSECVLTPHAGEFKRLWPDLAETAPDRIAATRLAAERAGACVVHKGADTIIAAPDGRVRINSHSAPWLATAGSGDVLSGMIGGLLAQGMPAFDAASAAVWLHGEIGCQSGPGLIAEDMVERIPSVLSRLHNGL